MHRVLFGPGLKSEVKSSDGACVCAGDNRGGGGDIGRVRRGAR